MIKKLKIWILLLPCLFFIVEKTFAQEGRNQLVIFTDREYCVSGDTVWFKVFMDGSDVESGDVVRVQLDKNGEYYINGVAKKINSKSAEGFIHIPDSLSTGVYFITAYLNANRNATDLVLQTNTLLVYNRFDEQVNKINQPEQHSKIKLEDYSSNITIQPDRLEYKPGETVNFELKAENSDLKFAVVKAELMDPLSAEIGGKFYFHYKTGNQSIPDFAENHGLLISGKVTDKNLVNQKGILTFLSITGEQSYLDYYVTGEEGDFHFFLKDAVGATNAVIQIVSSEEKEYLIQHETNWIKQTEPVKSELKALTVEQSNFISEVINSNFFSKIFNPAPLRTEYSFEMPIPYDMPFYGQPTRRINPEEFIDLPNFQEISRELLSGVQYRERKGEITFRMLNQTRGTFFDNEPLRLINGIPVFKNSYFADLKSTDINFIDIVQQERVFGDLIFRGVLEVNLKDKSNSWMAQQQNIMQIRIDALQPESKVNHKSTIVQTENIPDLRKNYLWEQVDVSTKQNLEFQLSDLKGKVKITVEGLTKDNKIFIASKTINVK